MLDNQFSWLVTELLNCIEFIYLTFHIHLKSITERVEMKHTCIILYNFNNAMYYILDKKRLTV